MFRFEDRRPEKTNNLLRKAISIKVPILGLLSELKNSGIRHFEREMMDMTLIDIKAHHVGLPQVEPVLENIIPAFLKDQ
jgi:hypothetical protein